MRPIGPMLAVLLAAGCAAKSFVRISPPTAIAPQGAPRLERAVDLGALPLPEQGPIPTAPSDGVLTPGEWVALVGRELGSQPAVFVAGRPLTVAGYLEGGSLLIRLPRGVPAGVQTLTVDNGQGRASLKVNVASYVWGADTRGDSLRFRRVGLAHLDEHPLDLDFDKARFAALSPEGGLLFAIQEPNYEHPFTPEAVDAVIGAVRAVRDEPATCEVLLVHLGARGGPARVSSLAVELGGRPTGIAAGPRGVVVVLEARQLTVLDASDPARPRVVARLPVASGEGPRELVDAEFLGAEGKLAVLEAYENRVHLVDLANPAAPSLAGSLSLADAHEEPFSIDLAPAPGGSSVYVLQGPNLRLAGKKLREGAGQVWTSARLGFKGAPGGGGAAQESLSRLVEVALEPAGLTITRSLPLPADLFPFFATADRQGRLFVSALHRQNPFENLSADAQGVLRLLEGLRDTSQFSRVIEIDPGTGQTSTVLQSIAIYHEVAVLPDGRLLASLMRLGPGYLPPRVTLDWGFEIVDGEFTKLREVANTSFKLSQAIARLLPPYRDERIGAQ